jgi:hypothetical protein
MTSHTELTLCAALLLLCCLPRAVGDKLQITSTPAGATVELDGVAAGVTPFEKDFPGPRRLAPHSGSPQIKQDFAQGCSRTGPVKIYGFDGSVFTTAIRKQGAAMGALQDSL